MPGNTIKITLNEKEELTWYVGDSQVDAIIALLNILAIPDPNNPMGVGAQEQTLEELLTSNFECIRFFAKGLQKELQNGGHETPH